jgi:hypothetical protein
MKARIGCYFWLAALFMLWMWLGYPDYLHRNWLIESGVLALVGFSFMCWGKFRWK